MAKRRNFQVRLTDEARAGLDRLANRHGITLTALLEALGLAGRTDVIPEDVIQAARDIDTERRSRRI